MQQNPYNKTHASASQLVGHLESRGLLLSCPTVAARKIDDIGYERLRIYFLSRRDPTQPQEPFRPGTTYKDILRLYELDAKLRNICFVGVGRFELVFRNRLSEILNARFGSHPYFDNRAFDGIRQRNEVLKKALQIFIQSKDQRAKHYRSTYTEPPLPPIWMLKEFLTFGSAARLYTAFAKSVRREVAGQFGVPSFLVFESWVAGFVDLRNVCAHHERLFNRRFQKQPQRLRSANIPVARRVTLKAQLECLDYALTSAGAKVDLELES